MTRWFGKNRAIWLGWLLVGALLAPSVWCSSMAFAQAPHRKRKEIYKEQVEKLEQAWRTAELDGDVSAMDNMLADDYIGIAMNGQVMTKVQQLDRARNRQLVIRKLDLDDVKVKLIGTTAVVTSLADVEGSMDGVAMDGKFRYTRVYTRLPSGAWKITNFEATQVGTPHPQPMPRNSPAPAPGGPQ